MKYISLSLCLLIAYSGVCAATDRTLVIKVVDTNMFFNSEMVIKGNVANQQFFNISGRQNQWRCSAFTVSKGVEIICHVPNSSKRWVVHSSIYCGSDDFMFFDKLYITCH